MSEFGIRNYHPGDLPALYRICLETGADGEDATGSIDPEILGHLFAGPYAVLEPELCFILTADGAPCGYILGTADSIVFEQRARKEWFPLLKQRYSLPDPADTSREAGLIRSIHAGYRAPSYSQSYPAHLHIDLLPEGQGQGHGTRLIHLYLDQLRTLDVSALHLGVSKGNQRAIAFYPRVGFSIIKESADSLVYGMRL
ncbi:MAG: GNAT family N-acetyltransferase [Pseudomonadales bacterium]